MNKTLPENNYRVTFGTEDIDYWGDFDKCQRVYMPHIIEIRNKIKNIVDYSWFFFEPHVELTWMSEREEHCKIALKVVEDYLRQHNLVFETRKPPERFGDWYTKDVPKNKDLEEEFGCKVHHHCSNIATEFYLYRDCIEKGKTKRCQFRRTIHRIANPLCINFRTEGWTTIRYGLRTLLIWGFIKMKFKNPLGKANWIGNKIDGGY